MDRPLPNNDVELGIAAFEYKYYIVGLYQNQKETDALLKRVRDYLERNDLHSVVLGVSGGIDSALALAVLSKIAETYPLRIHAEVIFYSMYKDILDISYLGKLKAQYKKNVIWSFANMDEVITSIHSALGYPPRPEVEANINYAARYLAFFAVAQQTNSITIGTTNADELDYAGWFGKHSDMMVDLQFLWKYPKCWIKEMAIDLGVPKEIISRKPTGDLIDGTSDEENFGCTYDELRWYSDIGSKFYQTDYLKQKFAKLNALRERNSHKYGMKERTHWNPIFL